MFDLWDVECGNRVFYTDDETAMRDLVKKLVDHHGEAEFAALSLSIHGAFGISGQQLSDWAVATVSDRR